MNRMTVITLTALFAWTATVPADNGQMPDPTGVYTLIEVDGKTIPTTVSHGAELNVLSGAFTITADKTCTSKIVFRVPGGEEIVKEVKATFTQEGSTLTMKWEGAGMTQGTIEGDLFTMNNEGMIFTYRRNPRQSD